MNESQETGRRREPARPGGLNVGRPDVDHFNTFGFVVLRDAFDPDPLAAEVDEALANGTRSTASLNVSAEADIGFRYLPMMSERAPVSLALLDGFADLAVELLGGDVLPIRAKAVEYHGEAAWHRDSDHDVRSVGFACYLDQLDRHTGALRVIPGSHQPEFGALVTRYLNDPGTHAGRRRPPDFAVATSPGDVIVLDEHLYHASVGGQNRRQWRVDYIADPVTADEKTRVRTYLASIYSPDWDGGYDVDRYPTYGPHWRTTGRPEWVARLGDLGCYDAAAAEEAFARSRRA